MNALGWVVLAWCCTSIIAATLWTWWKHHEPGVCDECIRLSRALREARTTATSVRVTLRRPDPRLERAVDRAHMRLTVHLLEHPDTAAAIWEGATDAANEAYLMERDEAGDRDG